MLYMGNYVICEYSQSGYQSGGGAPAPQVKRPARRQVVGTRWKMLRICLPQPHFFSTSRRLHGKILTQHFFAASLQKVSSNFFAASRQILLILVNSLTTVYNMVYFFIFYDAMATGYG
jgi:hypothetical protein